MYRNRSVPFCRRLARSSRRGPRLVPGVARGGVVSRSWSALKIWAHYSGQHAGRQILQSPGSRNQNPDSTIILENLPIPLLNKTGHCESSDLASARRTCAATLFMCFPAWTFTSSINPLRTLTWAVFVRPCAARIF